MRNLPCEVAFDENCFLDAIEEASTSKVPLRVFTLRVEAAYAHLPFHVPPALTKVLCLHNGKKTILVEKKKQETDLRTAAWPLVIRAISTISSRFFFYEFVVKQSLFFT